MTGRIKLLATISFICTFGLNVLLKYFPWVFPNLLRELLGGSGIIEAWVSFVLLIFMEDPYPYTAGIGTIANFCIHFLIILAVLLLSDSIRQSFLKTRARMDKD